jgi:hypothetical protein
MTMPKERFSLDRLRTLPLKLLLVAGDSLTSMVAVDLLTHITWPAGTVIHILTGVPDSLPRMEPSVETRSASEEALELRAGEIGPWPKALQPDWLPYCGLIG